MSERSTLMVQELLPYSLLALLYKRHPLSIAIAIAACNSPKLLLAESPGSCKVLSIPAQAAMAFLLAHIALALCASQGSLDAIPGPQRQRLRPLTTCLPFAGTSATIVATSTLASVTPASQSSSSGGRSRGHTAAIAVPVVLVVALAACEQPSFCLLHGMLRVVQ